MGPHSHRLDLSRLPLLVIVLATSVLAQAQESADELAKKLSNPVASLISVPLQYNADFNIGPQDGSRQLLNIQPVIPRSISADWNLITRVIVPVAYQDDVSGDSGSQFGLGDITPTLFFSPKQPTAGGWIWAAGPVFLLPAATDDRLGSGKWGVGPSALALRQTKGGFTYGVLVNHIWSVAGEDERADISNTFLQPFLAKVFPGGRTLSFNFESSYDWENGHWNVPLNIGYSKVTKLGGQQVSFAGGVRYYFETPGDGPDWGVRFTLTLLYPSTGKAVPRSR